MQEDKLPKPAPRSENAMRRIADLNDRAKTINPLWLSELRPGSMVSVLGGLVKVPTRCMVNVIKLELFNREIVVTAKENNHPFSIGDVIKVEVDHILPPQDVPFLSEQSATFKVSDRHKHSHYFKVCPYDHVDVYRVLALFGVTDPCLQHAVKKLLVAGGRGGKDISKDVQESIDSLSRWQEMRREEYAVKIS